MRLAVSRNDVARLRSKRVDPTEADKGHHDVDSVSGVNLGSKLVTDAGLTARVGEDGRVDQRC